MRENHAICVRVGNPDEQLDNIKQIVICRYKSCETLAHIPHVNTSQMRKKSEIITLGVHDTNPGSTKGAMEVRYAKFAKGPTNSISITTVLSMGACRNLLYRLSCFI